jgi:Vitamin K-dependent gamma-carboxylase
MPSHAFAPPRSPGPFTLDTRSLALGRLLLGTLLLLDLGLRATDLAAHYTDAGVLPRSDFRLEAWDFLWSLHALGGSFSFEVALLATQTLFAFAMLLGFRTFWSTLGSAALLVSLHGRNPLLRDGQDDLLRVLLVWACLLPWGARWSLDRLRARVWHPLTGVYGDRVLGPATAGWVLQLLAVYWASAVAKLQSSWWTSGVALSNAFAIGRYETPLGQWLRGFPSLLEVGTFLVLGFELLGPFLLFFSGAWRPARGLAVGAFVAMHLGLALLLRLGLFPAVAIAAWLTLLPPLTWERLEDRLGVGALGGAFAPELGARLPRGRPFLATLLVAFGLALVLLFNLTVLAPRLHVPRAAVWAARALGLQQFWSLFSPNPVNAFVQTDGWVEVVAELDDGTELDVLAGGVSVRSTRPPNVADTFMDRRWRHHVANVLTPWPLRSEQRVTVEESRAAWLHFRCGEWNASAPPGRRARQLRLVWMQQRLGHPEDVAQPEILSRVVCPEASVSGHTGPR